MKFSTLFCLATLITNCVLAQDSIPNAGFENWAFQGTYYTPDEWSTLDALIGTLNFSCALDSTVVHSGKYAAKLTTLSAIQGQIAPALVTTGSVNPVTQVISGGVGDTARPLFMNGWYQYAPVGADTAYFSITLTKWNSGTNAEDVVGSGQVTSTTTTGSTWLEFTVPITYQSGSVPDSALILFFASSQNSPQVGSVLYLDDLSYSNTAPTGIKEVYPNEVSIYPNPASHEFNFDNEVIHATALELYAADGKQVQEYSLHGGVNTIDVSGMSSGVYMLRFTGKNDVLHHSSLVIEK